MLSDVGSIWSPAAAESFASTPNVTFLFIAVFTASLRALGAAALAAPAKRATHAHASATQTIIWTLRMGTAFPLAAERRASEADRASGATPESVAPLRLRPN